MLHITITLFLLLGLCFLLLAELESSLTASDPSGVALGEERLLTKDKSSIYLFFLIFVMFKK